MNEPLDKRVSLLEYRVDALEEDNESMSDTLKIIQDNLKQIKYIAIGAVAAFVVSQIGLLEVAKKFLHL